MLKIVKLTKAIWKKGRAVGLNELESAIEEDNKLTVSQFCKEYGLKKELKSSLACKVCDKDFRYVQNNTYLVCSCGNQINTETTDDLSLFRFIPDYDEIIDSISNYMLESEYKLEQTTNFDKIEFLREIGILEQDPVTHLRLLVATHQIDIKLISQLWIRLLSQKQFGVIVHAGISKDAEEIIDLNAASIPILFLDIETLTMKEFTSSIDAFTEFRRDLDNLLETVRSAGIFDQQRIYPATSFEIAKNLGSLAREGRERFEEHAIPLLHTLGAPVEFENKAFLPDGLLLLPKGYWILDAKSSTHGFDFNISERDKAIRYVSNLENKIGHAGPDWKFHGEIIITLTSTLTFNLIEKVNDQLVNSGLDSSIVILSFEGVHWLWEKTRSNATFWHIYDRQNDTDDLLDLRPVVRNRLEMSDLSRVSATNQARIVSENAFKALWDYVFERGEYFEFKGRDPHDVANKVQGTLLNNYMRLRTK